MASTKILIFYLFFLVIFGNLIFFSGITNEQTDLKTFMKIATLRTHLESNANLLSSVISVVLIPFLVIDFIIALIIILGVSFAQLPALLNIVLFTPLSIIIMFDYIIPTIRGN